MSTNLVVGAGLTGLTIAHALRDAGEDVLMYDVAQWPGGFARDEQHVVDGKPWGLVHTHGPHIFHTGDKQVWDFMCRFGEMVPTTFSSLARYESRLYPVPVNLLTFSIAASYLSHLTGPPFKFLNPHEVESVRTKRLEVLPENRSPQTFEGVARNRVGDFLYLEIFKNYTEAFWGRPCNLIPGSIAERIPVRFNLDPRYHRDTHDYVGVPKLGYSELFQNMAREIPITWGARPWLSDLTRGQWKRIFFTGDPSYLIARESQPYRGFNIDHAIEGGYPWQQIIDNTPSEAHRSFCSQNLISRDCVEGPRVVSYMHPLEADLPAAHYSAAYPLPWNRTTHERMLREVREEIGPRIRFAGRKALYKYLDMDRAILEAWATVKEALS